MTTYHCKFIGGPLHGMNHRRNDTPPFLVAAMRDNIPPTVDEFFVPTLKEYIHTMQYSCVWSLPLGKGEHKFSYYTPSEATLAGSFS